MQLGVMPDCCCQMTHPFKRRLVRSCACRRTYTTLSPQLCNLAPTRFATFRHRFELVVSDQQLIGMRRASQRIAARACQLLGDKTDKQDVAQAVSDALEQLSKE
jgi:hypothetical protein